MGICRYIFEDYDNSWTISTPLTLSLTANTASSGMNWCEAVDRDEAIPEDLALNCLCDVPSNSLVTLSVLAKDNGTSVFRTVVT